MSKTFSLEQSKVLKEIMQYRRDVRGNRFTDQTISPDIVNKLLEAALFAPSVGYSQPWQFVLIDNEDVKQQVFHSFQEENEHAKTLFSSNKTEEYRQLKLEGIIEAPLNIAVFYTPSKKPVLGQTSMTEMGKYSVVCAIQNMWLMARSLNIGMGWVSIINPDKIKTAVNAPKSSELIAYLCVGYVTDFLDEPELRTKKWEQKKEKEDVVFINQFTV